MYYTAAVCEDGHVIGAMYRPGQLPPKFCPKHGRRVYAACPNCHSKIRGAPATVVSAPGFQAPNFCPDCGKPYPWTEAGMRQQQEQLTQQIAQSGLNESEAQAANEYVANLPAGTATEQQKSTVEAFLKRLGPAGSVIWDQIKDFSARVIADYLKG